MKFEALPFTSSFYQIPLIARLVRPGEGYGRMKTTENGCEFSLVNDLDEPLVEFYDERYTGTFGIDGQFISRYYLSQIDSLKECLMGLCLDGAVPEWSITGDELRRVAQWAHTRLNGDMDASEITLETSKSYQTLVFSSDAQKISHLQSLGRNGWMKTLGVEVDYADDQTVGIRPINSRHEVGRCEIRMPKDKAHLQAMINLYQSILDAVDASEASSKSAV